ncbi:hypothetical protein F4804DRAFT_353275 [Jackrogersella minutella]|nr:hypothetical protein F4804DRAFT_353275 [Jackrogersella minutella]
MDDPWDWDVDRVVRELCSAHRSWDPPSLPLKFPPAQQLEAALREQDADGHTILTYDHVEICRELGLDTLKAKATLKHAIGIFRARSQKFAEFTNGSLAAPVSEEAVQPSSKEKGKRRAPTHSPSHHVDDNSQPKPDLQLKPAGTSIPLQPVTHPSLNGPRIPETQTHSAKRRRVVPVRVSADIDANVNRNIPTEADIISVPKLRTTHTPGAYLGEDALTRIDILGNYYSLEDNVQDQNDQVEFSQRSKILRGRRVQVHQIVKRRMLRKTQMPRDPYVRADLVHGANDPNHDELLPLYGDSDEEYDSETWEEIEEETLGRAENENQSGLSRDEVQAVIDKSIRQFASEWKERKLLKLTHKANRVWMDARKAGLRRSINKNRSDRDACEARIAKYREEILAQNWPKVAELKVMTSILQQSVEDREHHSWVLDIINAPVEPEKRPRPAQDSTTRRSRAPKQIDPDEELLTSDSEVGLDEFIVDDTIQHTGSVRDWSPMDVSEDDDVSHVQQHHPREQRHQNPEPMDFDQTDTIDLTQLDEDVDASRPNTPSQPRKRNVIDLTNPRKSVSTPDNVPVMKPGSTSTVDRPESIMWKSQASTLIMQIDDLEPAEKLVAEQLAKLDSDYLSDVFTLAMKTRLEDDWLDAVRHEHVFTQFPKPPHTPSQRKIVAVYTVLRLFETYKEKALYSVARYKKLTYDDIVEKIEAWKADGSVEESSRYIDFLCRLSDRFEWKSRILQVEDGTPRKSPAVKQKRVRKVIRNLHAESLREADRAREEEQQHRRQVLYAKLEASGEVDHLVGSQKNMIINESKADHHGFIYVHPEIARRIKEHQVGGVRFMWNQIVDSVTKQGCLLAHTMGLGKTMQIITLLVAISQAARSDDPTISSQIPPGLRESKTLILCPPALIDNWMDELLLWAPEDHGLGEFFKVHQATSQAKRLANITTWDARGGILICGYNLFKSLYNDEDICEILRDGPNIVVADEAHEMKNPTSQVHIATGNFRTHSRIALTGSPLANKIEEYHSMINWVAPNYLSDLREFRADYANPIRRGLQVDSTMSERRHALKMLRVLKQEVAPKVQRVTTAVLRQDIPNKKEFVLTVPLTNLQREAYETFIRYHLDNQKMSQFGSTDTLGVICAHPSIFLRKLQSQIPDSTTGGRSVETLPDELVSTEIALIKKTPDPNEYSLSWKVPILLSILDECKLLGDAVLIFSQSILTLDYLEHILRKRKLSSVRIDGSTPTNVRQSTVKDFNQGQVDVFLISTRAGGIGLNMTGANRVIVFDAKFNPQHEQQAVGRAYRIGQKKPVYVYRLVCGGTSEEKLLNIAVWKMQLASRVVDKKNPIPKAERFGEKYTMPTEPDQGDIDVHTGKDSILDHIVEKHREGIRAITMMDTFEEEELEDAVLTAEDRLEADWLVAQSEARRSGKPNTPASQKYAQEPIPTEARQAYNDVPVAPIGSSQFHNSLPNAPRGVTRDRHGNLNTPMGIPLLFSNTAVQSTFAPPPNKDLHPQTHDSVYLRDFELRLTQLLAVGSQHHLTSHRKLAKDMGEAILSREHPWELQEEIRREIESAARSKPFVDAINSGRISPAELARLDPSGIKAARDWYVAKSQKLATGRQSEAGSEHFQHVLREMSTPERQESSSTQQKPHKLDDRQALEAVIERRKSKQPSDGKDPRLPNWAINAVTKQRRIAPPPMRASSVSSTSASHLSSKSPFK